MAEQQREQNPQLREDLVFGRNSVLELLKSGKEIESVHIAAEPKNKEGDRDGKGNQGGRSSLGSLGKIIALCRDRGIPIKEVSPVKLDYMSGNQSHQGVIAVLAAAFYVTLEEILEKAGDEPPFLIIADDIEDPHNLGAIIRTAEAAGAHGLILPKRGGVGLTATVHKTSAGALSHLPVTRVSNLASTVEQLKKQGIWVYGADMEGQSWCETDYSGPVALIIGSEGKGMSRLLRDKCDFLVSLPMKGQVNSLNASVAAGIVLYEIARQRSGLGRK